jgi:hypothetical protein
MKRQGAVFIAVLLPVAVGIGALVWRDQPLLAVGVGTLGVLVHWVASRDADRDGELADSSYFFGFVLTLVFLAVGLQVLGSSPVPAPGLPDAQQSQRGSAIVLGFLQDLAAGLSLTIVGLVVRQVRTLSAARLALPDPAAQWQVAMQKELGQSIGALIDALRNRPEAIAARELSDARSHARDAVDTLDRSIASAADTLSASVGRLNEAVDMATTNILRAGSALGTSLAESAQRMEAEVAQVLAAIEGQRRESAEGLREAQAASAAIRADASSQIQLHLQQWKATLEQARSSLAEAHQALDTEYRRGLAGFAASGTAFADLADRAARDVQALPNPAERLGGLWDGVRALETDLTESLGGVLRELGALRERSEQATRSLQALSGTTEGATAAIGAGGKRLGEALQRELQQMNGIIEEYTSLLERTTGALAAGTGGRT